MAIQTQWSYSLDTEVRRIYITFVKIVSTYFRQRDIPIAYPPVTKKLRNTVIIPRLDLHEIRRMRSQFSRVDDPYRFETPSAEARLQIQQLYDHLHDEEFPRNNIVELWRKHDGKILQAINSIIPHVLDPIQNIHIIMTRYGTRASFELCKKNDSVITIYLRADAEMYDLVFSILSALLRPTLMQRHHNTWAEAQLLVDWIISDTVLGTVFREIGCDDYKTLLSNIRSGYDANIMRTSKEIYERLEIGREQTEFYILRNEVLHNGKKISNLSFGEHRILMSLIENREGVVTYETIASLILQKEEAFSLYSISKRIQRLRDKLEEVGIGKHHIQTVRGVGFRIQ